MTAPQSPVEHHLATVRTGRYFTIGAAPKDARHVWFVLHGYAQLAARGLRHFAGIVPADTMIVAPEALSRFYLELPRPDGGHLTRVGAAWLTREDRDADIDDTTGWLDRVHREIVDTITAARGESPGVTVMAFSQGVATAMRWVANGVVHPARFIAWAGTPAADVNAEHFRDRLGTAPLIFVLGDRDQFIESEAAREQVRGAWRALGLAPSEVTYDGTHELNVMVLAGLLSFSLP